MTGPERLPLGLPLASLTSGPESNKYGEQQRTSAGNTPRELGTRRRPQRLNRQGLAELAAALPPRHWAVLRAVADHRFLTTKQLQRLVFSGHATDASAARTCRRVTEQLRDQHILTAVQRRIGGVRAGSAAQVWSTGPIGRRLLALASADQPRRHAEPSERFLRHALAIADLHVRLVEADRARSIELVNVELEPHCWRRFLAPSGSQAVLQPDLAVTTGAGDYEDVWFIEVDLGNEHLPTLARKCQQYAAYRRTGQEQAATGSFPIVVWLLDSEARIDRLTDAIARATDLDPDLFRVTDPAGFMDLLINQHTKGGDRA